MNKKHFVVVWAAVMLLLVGCSSTRTEWRQFTASSMCPVHHVEMKETPVIYGYPSEELLEKAERGEVILGGCIIRKNMPKTGYICPVDRKIYYLKKGDHVE